MFSCRGSTRICTRRMRLNSNRFEPPGMRASTIRPSPPSTLPSPRWCSRRARSRAGRCSRSRHCGRWPTWRLACCWRRWPAGPAARFPRPSCCSPGRRCWWSRRPGADTSSPSAFFCSRPWSSLPCPLARPDPRRSLRTRPTPIRFPAAAMPTCPGRVPCRGDGRRGRWAPRWPSRRLRSLRPSPLCRRSPTAMGRVCWRRVRACWSSSIFPMPRRARRSGPGWPPTRNIGARTRGRSPSSKPFCRGRWPPGICPGCSCSRSWPGPCSRTSMRSGPCSGSSARDSCSRPRSIPGTRSGSCLSRRCAGTGPGSC